MSQKITCESPVTAVVESIYMQNRANQSSLPTRKAQENDEYEPFISSQSSPSSSTLSTVQLNTARSHGECSSQKARVAPKWLQSSTQKTNLQAVLQSSTISQVISWLRGPSPSRPYAIDPMLSQVQSWPQGVLSRYLMGRSLNPVSIALLIIWLVVFGVVLASSNSRNRDSSLGQPSIRLACDTRLWPNTTFCGLNGQNCLPFNGTSFSFFCPSDCASMQVLEPHTIGNREVIYSTMVIGGPTEADPGLAIYRGDSFICPAAIHAGIIDDANGGCGILTRQGEQRHFLASQRNDIQSIGFPSSFPISFSFAPATEKCHDPQWRLFAISAIATTALWILTPSSSLLFALTFIIVFFQIALASDPPYFEDYASVLSIAFERFLPTVFVGLVLYRYCVRRTLHDLTAHFEKTVLWLGGCWIGALNNYTLDKMPISRLTTHDLRQQPGAITALIIILLVIFAAAVGQIWAFQIEGRLLRYLGFYILVGILIGCLIALPGLEFRLHHYIIALLLLPGTSLQTRPSLLYQGILLGLFINGVARWGYASILQTSEALREDGQLGSALPSILQPIVGPTNITFTIPELAYGFDGLSVLVNDVERYHEAGISLPAIYEWPRTDVDDPLFFRFAFTGTKPLGGMWYGDYTKPGTWYANGTWEDILPGPSR